MASSTYQLGGIFQAIKNSNGTEENDENELSELFSFKPVEKEEEAIVSILLSSLHENYLLVIRTWH